MPQVGTPHRILYIAKNRTSGLSGIIARIIKPDNNIIGDFAMTEFSNILFKGMYYADIDTTSNDPVGTWVGVTYSPHEGNHLAEFTIEFTSPVQVGDTIVNQITNGVSTAVWSAPVGTPAEGSFGDYVQNSVLSVAKFLGSK